MSSKTAPCSSSPWFSSKVWHYLFEGSAASFSFAIFISSLFLLSANSAHGSQSFSAPATWVQEFSLQQGFGYEHPRTLADVNGDGKLDVVGFSNDGVMIGVSNGFRFDTQFALGDFGYNSGWRSSRNVRLVGDINGDRRADIVGFGNAGVYTALSTGARFGQVSYVVADFGYDQGWRVESHDRMLADVSGDGRQDIVAFGNDGVWLAIADGAGGFSSPVYAVAELGFNQGWRPQKHLRTMGDINGDGRQDIVAFGDDGVWVAHSVGTGFAPAQLVLGGFGLSVGSWQVSKHPRILADVNNDGKQDIVGFGDAGVYVSFSNGVGFDPMQFVLADFGYNSGWRVATHPRFVMDINGDGYKGIVGYGQRSVYRALGNSRFGFGPNLGVLRDLVAARSPFSRSDSAVVAPRSLGDVNGDWMPDLVAFDATDIKVSLSSTAPPPPPPAAPSRLRILSANDSSISIAWNDNSNNERQFLIYYGKRGGSTTMTQASANSTSRQLSGLDANTEYCFSVEAENLFGVSASTSRVCHRTDKKIEMTTIYMDRQPIIEGPVPYLGNFGPIYSGAVITNINFPTQYKPVLLLKPGHSTNECNNSNAVVLVHGDMTAAQKTAVWGTASITLGPSQKLNFVGCTTDPQLPSLLPINITWRVP